MLESSISALGELRESPPYIMPAVCFHFGAPDGAGDVWGEETEYCKKAREVIASLNCDFDVDYVGGWSGIEIWESVLPTLSWIEQRIPQMFAVAVASGTTFQGWSFEPRGDQGFTVSQSVRVLDGSSDETRALIDEMKAKR
jgi:hypothetical protein